MSHRRYSGRTSAILVALCLFISGCGSSEPSTVPDKAQRATPSPRSSPRVTETDPDSDESDSEGEVNNRSEEDETADTEADSEAREFHGYPCTDDCSGHEAGYAWAERNEIHDPDDCGGNSQSFIEGCRLWAEENP